jgi:hypothetical protein
VENGNVLDELLHRIKIQLTIVRKDKKEQSYSNMVDVISMQQTKYLIK